MNRSIRPLLSGAIVFAMLFATLLELVGPDHWHMMESPYHAHSDAPNGEPDSPDPEACNPNCHSAGHLLGLVHDGAALLPPGRPERPEWHVGRASGRDSPPPTPPPNI